MAQPRIEFWFEFASTYAYLSAMRLPDLARARGVEVVWRPFLLGPIFQTQGWKTSPFNIYPAKGAYMWRDMSRRAAEEGLEIQRPDPFPQNGLLAARVAQCLPQGDRMQAFCQQVYLKEFSERKDISDPSVVAACADAAGLDATILDTAQSASNKDALRQATQEAQARGIFGAPSFFVGDELFWGDDRLDAALDLALQSV